MGASDSSPWSSGGPEWRDARSGTGNSYGPREDDWMARRVLQALLVGTLASSSMPALAGEAVGAAKVAPDAPSWFDQSRLRPESFARVVKRSLYVPGADGTRLAVDIYLPEQPSPGQLPTILELTRYYRSDQMLDDPVGSCRSILPRIAFFAKRGYAVVIVDARGTGASFGSRKSELSDEELRDGGAVLDWIARQPWSNGRVGVTGVSYIGTAAELLVRSGHPALKAAAPVSAGYDFYSDIIFPGGSREDYFIKKWGTMNAALDEGRPSSNPIPEWPPFAKMKGPCPVDGDEDGKLLASAIAEHQGNFNFTAALPQVEFRDDWTRLVRLPQPYDNRRAIDAAGVPMLFLNGWVDAGYATGGIHRLINTTSPSMRLIIGPSSHGLSAFYEPGVTEPLASSFNFRAEVLRFFDHYLGGVANGYEQEPRVRWFTTGSNTWHSADRWPEPLRVDRFCFGKEGVLGSDGCGSPSRLVHTPTADAATGTMSRWNAPMGMPVAYSERSRTDEALLSFTSAPLTERLLVTGTPLVTLKLRNSARDADYFVYLEQVDPQGRSFYVTEGILRASHSRPGELPYRSTLPSRSDLRADQLADTSNQTVTLRIGLQPFSHVFPAGSRLRVAIAGSDSAHFTSPSLEGQRWTVELGTGGSSLELPIGRPQ
jgi:uncharacterized protein